MKDVVDAAAGGASKGGRFGWVLLVLAVGIVLLTIGVSLWREVSQFTAATQLVDRRSLPPDSDVLELVATQVQIAATRLQAWSVLVQLLSAFAVAIALVSTAWNIRQTQMQIGQAQREFERTMDVQLKQLALAQQAHVTDSFTRATDQLGSNSQMTRLGGIFSISRTGQETIELRQPTIYILEAYIKQYAQRAGPLPRQYLPTSIDVQSALTALISLIRDQEKSERRPVDLFSTVLHGAKLNDAILEKAFLSMVSLNSAEMVGARLQGAQLFGASLFNANLTNANLMNTSLKGANLQKADLSQAKLNGAELEKSNLQEAKLTGANLTGASLVSADLAHADLRDAILQDAHLEDANLSSVTGLTQAQINTSYMNATTVLPGTPGPNGQPYQHSPRV